MTLAKLNRAVLAMVVGSAGLAMTGNLVKDSDGGMHLEFVFGQSLAKDGDSSGSGSSGSGGDHDGGDSSGSGSGGGDSDGDRGGGDDHGGDRDRGDHDGDDRGGDRDRGDDHDRDDDRDHDRGRHGRNDDDDDHRGRHGRDSRPVNLADFFAPDRERGSVAKAEIEGSALEVTYSDGWKEEVENGRYELKDPTNQTVVERPATQSDIDRLNSAF